MGHHWREAGVLGEASGGGNSGPRSGKAAGEREYHYGERMSVTAESELLTSYGIKGILFSLFFFFF